MLRARAVLLVLLVLPWTARAESALLFPYPQTFGTIPASTYDTGSRQRVGSAHLVVEKLANGVIRMLSESGIDDGARTIAMAELEVVEPETSMRLIRQESRSFLPDGASMGLMEIDHRKGVATCNPPPGNGKKPKSLDLDSRDEVANVPLNLLFEPLARGEVERVEFDFMTCRFGPRIVKIEAKVASNGDRTGGAGQIVEVRYKPDLGMVSFLAGKVLPKLSFWFDPKSPSPWLAHRIPLYSKGPEIFVVRDGIPSEWFPDQLN